MNGRFIRLLPRLGLAIALLCMAAWAALAAVDRSDAANMAGLSDTAFRVRMAAGLPDGASAYWYAAVGERALRIPDLDPDFAISAFERSLQLEDRDGETWARLAHARFVAGMSASSVSTALGRSYQRMPVAARQFRAWRLRLAEAAWQELPVGVRAQAAVEARTQSRDWLAENTPDLMSSMPE